MDDLIGIVLALIFVIAILIIIVTKDKTNEEQRDNIIIQRIPEEIDKFKTTIENKTSENSDNRINPDVLKMGMKISSVERLYPTNKNQIDYSSLYEKKEFLLTSKEYTFYKLLKPICNRYNLSVNCQVSLYEIVKLKTRNYIDFNRIRAKTIDYVITDANCKIKLCIELDDSTHIKEGRQKRDKFLNELFNALNIKFLQIPAQRYYKPQYISYVEEKIKESL